ncbi:alkaline phosphatase family protein [Planctomycetota bacterium]
MANTKSKQNSKRCLVLGMDGLDFQIVSELIKQKKLPNFSRLANKGTFTALGTSNPAISPVAWSNIACGAGPGCHGIFDFLHRDPQKYMPYLSLRNSSVGLSGTKYKKARQCDGFWKYTSKAGIPTSVMRWPVTFPAEKVSGRFLSGLGTPDLLGSEGEYNYYTTKIIAEDDPSPHNVTKVRWEDGFVYTFLKGPFTGKEKQAELPLVVSRKNSDAVFIDLGDAPIIEANRGQWTAWVKMAFKVGLGRVHGMVRFLLIESEPYLRLFVTPINITASKQAFAITSPAEFGRELEEKIGSFHTLGMPTMVHPLSHNRYGYDEFLSQVQIISNERKEMFFNELDRFDNGLLAFVFDHTDRLQHALWSTRDECHISYNKKEALLYGNVIEQMYHEMDDILGKTLERIDDETALFVISDHGFGRFERQVHLNRWLIENNYMHLKGSDSDEGQGLFGDVDWERTRAYAVGFASIYINQASREGCGIVKGGIERDELCKEIAAKLPGIVDLEKDTRVVHRVYRNNEVYGNGPLANNGPDILVGFNKGYRFSWQTAIGAAPIKLLEDNNSKWSGDHIFDPSLIPGILLSNVKINRDKPRGVDIAPTVLEHFGLSRPAYMTGSSLLG